MKFAFNTPRRAAGMRSSADDVAGPPAGSAPSEHFEESGATQGHSRQSERVGNRVLRKDYTSPALTALFASSEFLEVLGPAQAAYGGMGMP